MSDETQPQETPTSDKDEKDDQGAAGGGGSGGGDGAVAEDPNERIVLVTVHTKVEELEDLTVFAIDLPCSLSSTWRECFTVYLPDKKLDDHLYEIRSMTGKIISHMGQTIKEYLSLSKGIPKSITINIVRQPKPDTHIDYAFDEFMGEPTIEIHADPNIPYEGRGMLLGRQRERVRPSCIVPLGVDINQNPDMLIRRLNEPEGEWDAEGPNSDEHSDLPEQNLDNNNTHSEASSDSLDKMQEDAQGQWTPKDDLRAIVAKACAESVSKYPYKKPISQNEEIDRSSTPESDDIVYQNQCRTGTTEPQSIEAPFAVGEIESVSPTEVEDEAEVTKLSTSPIAETVTPERKMEDDRSPLNSGSEEMQVDDIPKETSDEIIESSDDTKTHDETDPPEKP